MMANAKSPAHEHDETAAETTDRIAKSTAEATAENAERATRIAADAAERTANAMKDSARALVETVAGSVDHEAVGASTRESISRVARTQQQTLESMERAGTSILTALSEVQKEIAGFVSERIRQDLQTQQELLACRTLDDVREVQSRFLRSTIDQYSAEASKLMRLGAEIATRSLEPAQADTRAH
jgi:hypothetical protein